MKDNALNEANDDINVLLKVKQVVCVPDELLDERLLLFQVALASAHLTQVPQGLKKIVSAALNGAYEAHPEPHDPGVVKQWLHILVPDPSEVHVVEYPFDIVGQISMLHKLATEAEPRLFLFDKFLFETLV